MCPSLPVPAPAGGGDAGTPWLDALSHYLPTGDQREPTRPVTRRSKRVPAKGTRRSMVGERLGDHGEDLVAEELELSGPDSRDGGKLLQARRQGRGDGLDRRIAQDRIGAPLGPCPRCSPLAQEGLAPRAPRRIRGWATQVGPGPPDADPVPQGTKTRALPTRIRTPSASKVSTMPWFPFAEIIWPRRTAVSSVSGALRPAGVVRGATSRTGFARAGFAHGGNDGRCRARALRAAGTEPEAPNRRHRVRIRGCPSPAPRRRGTKGA